MFDEENLDSFLDQCTESWICPLCAEKGLSARVKLFQANDNQAIYFCETDGCVYPMTDESDPIVVNRTVVEVPVDAKALGECGLPTSMLNEGAITVSELNDLLNIQDAYADFDTWARLEKDLDKLKANIAQEAVYFEKWKEIQLNPKCTPINHLRNVKPELVKYVKHFIPNIEEVVELLKMDIL